MLKKDSVLAGVLFALIFPAVAFFTAYMLKSNFYILNKPAVPYFVAIAFNLILVRICLKKELGRTARGVMLATFIYMVLIFIFKIRL